MSQGVKVGRLTVGNRWCIHPMEGWDAAADGHPTELTFRRWERFGASGAKMIWGGEAVAVQGDGRANPNQLLATPEHRGSLTELHRRLRESHRRSIGSDVDLVVGLQLTHSGRFSRPNGKSFEPRIAYHHPLLGAKYGLSTSDSLLWTDEELELLIERYVVASRVAYEAGFQFVDIKACHGYLLHEFLSARDRPGRFGGELSGRMRLLLTIIERVKAACPHLEIGVRLSLFDMPPFEKDGAEGVSMFGGKDLYRYGFGCDARQPMELDLSEPRELMRSLMERGVGMVNLTAGSPYYNPHIQRPAAFPPSDGYSPPEDPLVGVARQIQAVARFKQAFPTVIMVGSGYTYLQDYLVQVAQGVVRDGMVDLVGLGRMVLSYPTLPADSLSGKSLQRKWICRTFSDCTTAPRNGLVSGCYPLDPFYKNLPQANQLKELTQKKKA